MTQLKTLVNPVSVTPSEISFRTGASEPVVYTARCLAPDGGDWSISQLFEINRKSSYTYKHRLGTQFANRGVTEVFSPIDHLMSAVFLPQDEFRLTISLGYEDLCLHRPSKPSDATIIRKGQAFLITPGGCPLVVLSFIGKDGLPYCIAAHAGRKSLIDYKLILEGYSSRSAFSIVESIVAKAMQLGGEVATMYLRSFFSIPWEAYRFSVDDTRHGKTNLAVNSYLKSKYGSDVLVTTDGHEHYSLNKIIEAQARGFGIGHIETGWSLPYNGPYAYTTHDNPLLADKVRNLVTLIVES